MNYWWIEVKSDDVNGNADDVDNGAHTFWDWLLGWFSLLYFSLWLVSSFKDYVICYIFCGHGSSQKGLAHLLTWTQSYDGTTVMWNRETMLEKYCQYSALKIGLYLVVFGGWTIISGCPTHTYCNKKLLRKAIMMDEIWFRISV